MSPVPRKPIWEFDILSNGKKGRFTLKTPYDPQAVSDIKALGYAKWHATIKRWTFPLDLTVVNQVTALGKKHGANFIIDPDMKRWVQNERKRIASIVAPDDISNVNDDMLPRVKSEMPELWNALAGRPFQLLGAQFMADARQVLMADQPGMGKTIQTLAAIVENDIRGPILVVAPRSAANVTWPKEIRRWLGPNEIIYVINATLKPAERGALLKEVYSLRKRPERIWVICGPNYLRAKADIDSYGNFVRDDKGNKIIRVVNEGRPELFSFDWSAVVVDECHQTLAGATGNPKKQSAQRFGLGLLNVRDDGMRIALSGTPFRGKPHYMWGNIDWLYPDSRQAYWTWIEKHFGTTQSRFGVEIGDRIIDEEAFYSELKPFMVRRTKAEVVKDLPPKMYGGEPLDSTDPESPIAVWLPMNPKQVAQYEKMQKQALLKIQDEPDMPVNGILAEMIRLKQIANCVVKLDDNQIVDATTDSNKMDWIVEFLDERVGSGGKVIIASQFTKFLYELSKELNDKGFGHYMLTGRQNDKERVTAEREFQSGTGHSVFLLNTKAGGVSLTLDMADDVVICDSTFNPDDQEQVEDRAHRVSRMHNVTIWNLCSLNTIDESIARLTADRESMTKGVIDGQRGVTFAKQLVDEMRSQATRKDKNEKQSA